MDSLRTVAVPAKEKLGSGRKTTQTRKRVLMLQDRPKKPSSNAAKTHRLNSFLKKGKDLQTQHDACVLTMVIFPNTVQMTKYTYAFNPIAEKWLKSPAGEYFKKSFMQFCEAEIVKDQYSETLSNCVVEDQSCESMASNGSAQELHSDSQMESNLNSVAPPTEQPQPTTGNKIENSGVIKIIPQNAGKPPEDNIMIKLVTAEKKSENKRTNFVFQYKGNFERTLLNEEANVVINALVAIGDVAVVAERFFVKKVEERKFLITQYSASS